MRIDILYRAPWRGWQARLADALARTGHRVRPVLDPVAGDLSWTVTGALRLQQVAFGPRHSLFRPAPLPAESGAGNPDLVLALDGAKVPTGEFLEPVFVGVTGDTAMLAAVSSGGAVALVIRGRHGPVTKALLAVEHQEILSRGLDQLLARLVTLLVQAIERAASNLPIAALPSEATRTPHAPFGAIIKGTGRKLVGRLRRSGHAASHWRIGYRITGGAGLADGLVWPDPFFHVVPGPSDRFYADPIPVVIDGRRWIFVEDYPYATRKGVIAAMEILSDGTAGPSRTVLEHDVHLSYPFIVQHDGAIYMLPEMGAARRVQLFRADPFPDRWVADRVLLDDLVASDATPVQHAGRWWMFATVADDGGSTWDSLCLFHAPDLFGPWTPHAGNPVLVDAGAARPAGPMWHENGVLMRVVQDCRDGYGRGLAVCRVDRLDEGGYTQTVLSRLGAPAIPGADGAHTLAKDDCLEVIDIRFTRCE